MSQFKAKKPAVGRKLNQNPGLRFTAAQLEVVQALYDATIQEDQRLADWFFDRITREIGDAPAADPAQAEALATAQAEIARLKDELKAAKTAQKQAAKPENPTPPAPEKETPKTAPKGDAKPENQQDKPKKKYRIGFL